MVNKFFSTSLSILIVSIFCFLKQACHFQSFYQFNFIFIWASAYRNVNKNLDNKSWRLYQNVIELLILNDWYYIFEEVIINLQ